MYCTHLADGNELLPSDYQYHPLVNFLTLFPLYPTLSPDRNAFQSDENIRLQQQMATLTRDNHHLKRKLVCKKYRQTELLFSKYLPWFQNLKFVKLDYRYTYFMFAAKKIEKFLFFYDL